MRAGHDAYQPSCLTACHETDDNDSFSDTSDSNPSKEGVVTSDEAEVEIAVKESKEVRQVRCFLFIVLFLSLIGAVLVYLYFYWSEERNFEEEYLCQAERILGVLEHSFHKSVGALDVLALSVVSIARSSDQKFPFVTIPEFGSYAAKVAPLTGALTTSLVPIVRYEQRLEWEEYAAGNNTYLKTYVDASHHLQDAWSQYYGPKSQDYSWTSRDIIYGENGNIPYNTARPNRSDILLPNWHTFPLVANSSPPANWDWYDMPNPGDMTRAMTDRRVTISQPYVLSQNNETSSAVQEASIHCEYFGEFVSPRDDCAQPFAYMYYPVIDTVDFISIAGNEKYPEAFEVKAFIISEFYWGSLFRDMLQEDDAAAIFLVLENTCSSESFSYRINGLDATYLGRGSLHEKKYDGMLVSSSMSDLILHSDGNSDFASLPVLIDSCEYIFRLYPSDEFRAEYLTNNRYIFAFVEISFVFLPVLALFMYDRKVKRKQKRIITAAKQSEAIISSLFPTSVMNQLYPTEPGQATKFGQVASTRPIAELYPETTVLFADITEFTVWSSIRDPSQVFTLLESVYSRFDEIAERRRVFKVETVGDCYVSVAGLPNPCSDHAVVMAKFARDITYAMSIVTSELETILGPGTSNLELRVGLNSGPTTAGVLRGAKSRFQLFGDTVNTASRMESHSSAGKIMCSKKTADILIEAGKGPWITPREDFIDVKGKGMMQCYWIAPKIDKNASTSVDEDDVEMFDSPEERLHLHIDDYSSENLPKSVRWMTTIFIGLLRDVLIHREATNQTSDHRLSDFYRSSFSTDEYVPEKFTSPRNEVTEMIVLPRLDSDFANLSNKSPNVKISDVIRVQMEQFINSVAKMYINNPFHCFDHACHVVMTTQKLLARVIQPDDESTSATAYGITSDPLTHFAILFSALVHDVDHPGVSNAQLVKEMTETATRYNNQSVAEQNSVTIAWDLLMEPRFFELRNTIIPGESEVRRFRQLVVNSVMATDLFDAELKLLRENRWNKAFHPANLDAVSSPKASQTEEDTNRRATIVIEHIIQASDVAHTMQHWHVYQKWNSSLLHEMYAGYAAGRAEKNPLDGWYEGELWFFDNYIIPLAKKLKTCGVFGVSCDELLDYANDNRAEWAAKGRDIVASHAVTIAEKFSVMNENVLTTDP